MRGSSILKVEVCFAKTGGAVCLFFTKVRYEKIGGAIFFSEVHFVELRFSVRLIFSERCVL